MSGDAPTTNKGLGWHLARHGFSRDYALQRGCVETWDAYHAEMDATFETPNFYQLRVAYRSGYQDATSGIDAPHGIDAMDAHIAEQLGIEGPQ